MSVAGLTFYVLVWPVIAAAVLGVLVVSVIRDARAARKNNEEMV